MWQNILDRISFVSLFLTIVLLPVFFLPFTLIPVGVSKGLLIVVGLSISVIAWAGARFSDGKVSFPRSPITLAFLGVVAVTLISAFFSGAQSLSMFGTIFDLGTFWFMFAALILLFMSSVMIRDNKNAQMLLFGVILSTTLVFLFQVFRFFLPETLSLGVLGGATDNLVGSFNSLGLMAGLTSLICLFVLEFFSVTKPAKFILGLFGLISLFVVAAVNFMLVWELLGLFALFIFVYKISSSKAVSEDGKVHFPAFSFALVMISLLFFMSGQFIGGYLPNRLNLSNTEVSPSFSATMGVTKAALRADPVLGLGPNRFAEVWAMHKPASINDTVFWNTSFASGSGVIPTFAATGGYLGILSWFVFFWFLFRAGIKSLFGKGDRANRGLAAYFVLLLYLLLVMFFYSAGPVLVLLTFAFTGVFVGLLSSKENGLVTVSFLDDHRKSFFFILSLVLIMVLSAAAAFKYIERFASVSYYGKAVQAETVADAEVSISKAISLHQNDLYMRTYAEIYFVKMNTLLNKGSELTEAEKAELQADFDQAIGGANGAVAYDPSNYLNHQTLGDVYNAAGALGVKDAYVKAIESYQTALTLNPLNPGIDLAIARVYLAQDNTKDAKDLANKSLELKPDYIDALLTLSQIAKKDGDNVEAISYAEKALALAPTNEDLIKYVDSVKAGN